MEDDVELWCHLTRLDNSCHSEYAYGADTGAVIAPSKFLVELHVTRYRSDTCLVQRQKYSSI